MGKYYIFPHKSLKELLRMCPHDNMGIRFYLAGHYAGHDPLDVDEMRSKANRNQTWDVMDEMVKKQDKIHNFLPDEFKEF